MSPPLSDPLAPSAARAYLFDLDGTLINTALDIAAAVNATRARYDLSPLPPEEVEGAVGHGATELLRATLPAQLHPSLDEARGVFLSAYEAHLCVHTRPYEGVEEALARLVSLGARVALVTNKPERLTLPLLRALGWEARFDVVICGDTLTERKPHPLPLLTALERLGVPPAEAVFVGDTEVDAHAALAARVPLVVVPYGRAAPLAQGGRFGEGARVLSLSALANAACPPHPPPPMTRAQRLLTAAQDMLRSRARERLQRQVISALSRELKEQTRERFLGLWDLIVLLLSVYVLVALIAPLIWSFSPGHLQILRVFDHVVCGVFLCDFLVRFWLAESKLGYLRWGWLDLISSLPSLDTLRWGRLFRLVRVFRAFRSARLLHTKIERHLQDPFLMVAFVSFSVITFGALGVLYLEEGSPSANIKSAEDALWWAWVTITTVGYGDRYPVTAEGRLLAGAIMSAGVGLFGIFTVQCTQYFLKTSEAKEQASLEVIRDELRGELRALQAQLSRLEAQAERGRDAHAHPHDPPPPPPQ